MRHRLLIGALAYATFVGLVAYGLPVAHHYYVLYFTDRIAFTPR